MSKILMNILLAWGFATRIVLLIGLIFVAIIGSFGAWVDRSTDWWAIVGTLPNGSLIYLESASPRMRQSAVFPFIRYPFDRPGFHALLVSSWPSRQELSLLRNEKMLPILREVLNRSTWGVLKVGGNYGVLRTSLDEANHAAVERQLGQAYSAQRSSGPLRFYSIALPGFWLLFVAGGVLVIIMAQFAHRLHKGMKMASEKWSKGHILSSIGRRAEP